MEDLGVAGGGAGQQAFSSFSHQPLAVVDGHVAGHVLFSPGVQPGVKASVQACVDPLLGLKRDNNQNNTAQLLGTSSTSQKYVVLFTQVV